MTGQKPHFVQPSKTGGGFLCDAECLGYKSAKICTHTVAAALKTGDVKAFVCWYKKLKCNLNFTAVAESGKKPRKGATKKASKHIHSIIENASELQFKNRAPVNEATSTSTTHEQSTVLSTAQMPAFSVPQSSKTTQRRST